MSENVSIAATSIKEIASLLQGKSVWDLLAMDWVKQRFIRNHNLISKDGNGELAYQRQVLCYKKILNDNPQLAAASVDSHYRCLIQASVRGWSLDPADNQVYVLAYGKDAVLQPQAGAHIERLIKTGQIEYADQAQLVFQGDEFEVENGIVKKHVRKFKTEKIIAGYIKIVRLGSTPKNPKESFFIYTPENWGLWRKKSKQQNSENWTGGDQGQPVQAFLKTKIVLHATKEKCFASGETNLALERYDDAEWNDEVDSVNTTPEENETVQAENGTSEQPYAEYTEEDETQGQSGQQQEEIKW